MKRTIIFACILLALSFVGCNKSAPVDGPKSGDLKETINFGSILVSKATEATWQPENPYSLYVHDILKDASNNESVHINKDVISYSSDEKKWVFESGNKYQWKDGIHNFFGWTMKDGSLTSTSFWGSEPTLEGRVLTTPTKILTTKGQLDFLYSESVSQDASEWKLTKEKEDPVELKFDHLFSAFSMTVENLISNKSVVIKSVKMTSAFKNSGFATITFGAEKPVSVTTTTSATPFIANPMADNVTLATGAKFDVIAQQALANASPIFTLAWPQTFSGDGAEIEIEYKIEGDQQFTKSTVSIPRGSWESGTRYKYNLQIHPKDISLTFVVAEWDVVDDLDEIDTSDGSINMSNVIWVNQKITRGTGDDAVTFNTVDNSGYGTVYLSKLSVGDKLDGVTVTEETAGYATAYAFFTVNYPTSGTYQIKLIPAYGGSEADLQYFTITTPEGYPNLPVKQGIPQTIYFSIKVNTDMQDVEGHKAAINIIITPTDGNPISAYSEIRANYTLVIGDPQN